MSLLRETVLLPWVLLSSRIQMNHHSGNGFLTFLLRGTFMVRYEYDWLRGRSENVAKTYDTFLFTFFRAAALIACLLFTYSLNLFDWLVNERL